MTRLSGPIDHLYAACDVSVLPTPRLIIFADAEHCELVAGDLQDSLGLEMGGDIEREFALAQYNRIVARKPLGVRDFDDKRVIAYVSTVVMLVEGASRTKVLNSLDEIPEAEGKKIPLAVRRLFRRPTGVRHDSVWEVKFFTWSKLGGAVCEAQSLVLDDGRVVFTSFPRASAVGRHDTVMGRM